MPRSQRGTRRLPIPRAGLLAVIAFALSTLTVWIWSERAVRKAIEGFDADASGEKLSPEAFGRLLVKMEEQKKQYGSWAYTALAGLVAISVVKQVLPSPWLRWAYVLVGPAAVFLLQSIRTGVYFDQRMTFFAIAGTMNEAEFKSVQTLLLLQVTYVSRGLVVLLLFVGSFVIAIISGRLQLTSTEA